MEEIEQLAVTRRLVVGLGDGFGPGIRAIPPGFSNHPLWNFGHLAVTFRLLVYGRSGLPLQLDETLVADFRKGSSPAEWRRDHEWAPIRELLLAQPAALAADYRARRFDRYERYETSTGVVLASVEEAIAFNAFHEGIHLGYLLAQRRVLEQL